MSVQCVRCAAPNPEEKRFCGDCGAAMALAPDSVAPLTGPALQDMVHKIIGERFKDQKLVELEIVESIVTRLVGWAKMFAAFVGIPAALAVFVLGWLGISKYEDFTKSMAKVEDHINQEAAAADAAVKITDGKIKEIDALASGVGNRARSTDKQLNELSSQLGGLTGQVGGLLARVDRIEGPSEKLAFDSTFSSEDLARTLQDFVGFQRYLKKLGYEPTNDVVQVELPDTARQFDKTGDPAKPQADHIRFVLDLLSSARYENQKIIIERRFAGDEHLLYVAYMQRVIDPAKKSAALASNPYARAIRNALAIYYACSSTVKSLFAAKASAVVQRPAVDLAAAIDFNTETNDYAPEAWASAFWAIRGILGSDVADQLLWNAWSKSIISDFEGPTSFIRAVIWNTANMDQTKGREDQIRAIFSQRKIKPPS